MPPLFSDVTWADEDDWAVCSEAFARLEGRGMIDVKLWWSACQRCLDCQRNEQQYVYACAQSPYRGATGGEKVE